MDKMEITNDIKYVGVNDHDVDLFEGQYVVKNGMAPKGLQFGPPLRFPRLQTRKWK